MREGKKATENRESRERDVERERWGRRSVTKGKKGRWRERQREKHSFILCTCLKLGNTSHH